MQILRKVDRSGVLDDVFNGEDLMVIFSNGFPSDIAQIGLDRLVKKEVVEITDSGILVTNFLEAQEARASDAKRTRESRERRRAGITKRIGGYVYFLQSEDGGPIKIGFASDVDSRIRNIQTARPDKIRLLGKTKATIDDEQKLQLAFKDSAVGGEWFDDSQDLQDTITVASNRGISDAIEFIMSRAVMISSRAVTLESHGDTGRHMVTQTDTPSRAVPYCTIPTSTNKNPPLPPQGGNGSREKYSVEFEDFRSKYPGHRLGGKLQDWKSWKAAKKAGMTIELADEYLEYWLASPQWKSDGGKYVVALSRWLRDGYWQTMPSDYETNGYSPQGDLDFLRRKMSE